MPLKKILRPSPNFGPRRASPLDMIIIHYTGMQTAQDALDRLCDPEAEVSSHYMIDEAGQIFCLVEEAQRAWHAGVSEWQGRTDINSHSIGIELVNPGHEFGYQPFPEPQIQALVELCHDIFSRHDIKPEYILGHEDVAPGRKKDPGELFPWKELALHNGIGVWPHPASKLDEGKKKSV